MVLPNPSIQSFFQKNPGPSASQGAAIGGGPPSDHADGLAQSDAVANPQPGIEIWRPKGVYNEVNIVDLQPGPCKVRFRGRIVNISPSPDTNPGPKKAMLPKGYHFLVVKDDTGLVAIKLLVTGNIHDRLQLGHLVTIWAASATMYNASAAALPIPHVPLIVTVHPNLTSSSSIKFHPSSHHPTLYRLPLPPSPSITPLKTFLTATPSPSSARLLVCVSSILPIRTVKSKQPPPSDLKLLELRVFDESASCPLFLWQHQTTSARTWTPNATVLLLTNPRLRRKNAAAELGLDLITTVDVDPACADAEWLRKMAVSRTERQPVCVPFPEGAFGAGEGEGDVCTLAELDDRVRANPDPEGVVTTRVNVLFLGTKLAELARVGRLCCAEW